MTTLYYGSLADVCRRMKSGELSAVTVTESILGRIGALDGELASYATVLADAALEKAARLDEDRKAGKPLGALHGVPVAVKDLLFTRGVVTASGTVVMRDFVPEHDATVVSRLDDAGAVIVGKTQLTEGAFGAHHPSITPPRNPWNVEHWPGVSSSGSGVAVAAGMAFGALGSDTGGSIRFPSACCGLVGIKPTYGRVSRFGAFPLAESLDHIGPMTRTVEDAARMLQVIAGADANDPTTLGDPVPNLAAAASGAVAGLKIGVDWDYVSGGVEDAVVDTVREALDIFLGLGAEVCEVQMPRGYKELVKGWAITCGVECARAHADFYPARVSDYGKELASLIELGLGASSADYQALEALRVEFRSELDGLLSGVELLIAPCMPGLPPRVEEMSATVSDGQARAEFITFTAPFDYSGHPTITLPVGLLDGLPRAFQLVGRHLGEPSLVRAGAAFERAHPFDDHPIP